MSETGQISTPRRRGPGKKRRKKARPRAPKLAPAAVLPKEKGKAGRPVGKLDSKPRMTPARKQAAIEVLRGTLITPLQVFITTMQDSWEYAQEIRRRGLKNVSDQELGQFNAMRRQANDAARDAAPFIHPKLSAVAYQRVETEPVVDVSVLTSAERHLLLDMLRKGVIRPDGTTQSANLSQGGDTGFGGLTGPTGPMLEGSIIPPDSDDAA